MKTWPKSFSMFVVGLLLGLACASVGFAWLGGRASGAATGTTATRTLKLAHSLDPSHPVHEGMVYMDQRLQEISGGQMKLTIFASGQLGSETEVIEKVQAGTLDMTKTSTAPLGNFIQAMRVFSLPYIFRDGTHFWRVLDGPIGTSLLEGLHQRDDGSATGLRGLCWFDAGSRNFYSTRKPIRSPDDLRGMKIRVMNDPVAIAMVNSMGGAATPIDFGELYSSLQQGVVDGAENNPPSFMSSSHYETSKYFTFDEHTWIPDVVLISDATWQDLSPQERAWLRQAAEEASIYQRKLWKQASDEAVAAMKQAGVEVVYPDQGPFRAAVAGLLDRYADSPEGKLAIEIRDSP